MKRLLLLVVILLFLSCENFWTRNFGGDQTIYLPEGKKLVMVTWKDDDLWILTKNMVRDDKIESYEFYEKSLVGVFEGTLYIKEVGEAK